MLHYLSYLVFVGAIVHLLAISSYIKDMLKGRVKPNRVSWFLWSLAPLIGTAAAIYDGARWETLPVFISGFGPFLVFVFSFTNKESYWKLEKFDYFCGLFSVLALVLWGITKLPEIAIIFAIASDGFAALPTLKKSWKYPETENPWPFNLGFFNSLTSFAAINIWTFSAFAFPTYLALINLTIIFAIYHRRLLNRIINIRGKISN